MQTHQHLPHQLAGKENRNASLGLEGIITNRHREIDAVIETNKHKKTKHSQNSLKVLLRHPWLLLDPRWGSVLDLLALPSSPPAQSYALSTLWPGIVLLLRVQKKLRMGLCPSYGGKGRQTSTSHGARAGQVPQ